MAIMNVKDTICLKTGDLISREILGPANIDTDTYYRNIAGALINGNELKELAKKLQEDKPA